MNIIEIREFMISGRFHHATFRNYGTLWEGLHFYRTETCPGDGFRGFDYVGFMAAYPNGRGAPRNPDLDRAYELIRNTGYSVGAYGEG